MSRSISPVAAREESLRPLAPDLVRAEPEASTYRIWLWGSAKWEEVRSHIERCEHLSPFNRRFVVHPVLDMAEIQGFDGEGVCLLWRVGERDVLEFLARARAFSCAPPVVVVLDSHEDESAVGRILEAGASDCLNERDLSAPLLERSIRFALQNAERNARLERLSEDNVRLGTAIESTSIAMQMCGTIEQGCPISWVNPAFERLTGYSFEEVRGRHVAEVLEGEGSDPQPSAALVSALHGKAGFQTTILHSRQDGTRFWNEIHLSPMFDDATGHVSGWISHLMDVTARIENSKYLEQSRHDLEVAQRLTHLGSWWAALDNSGDLATATGFWSDELYRIVGLEPQSTPLRAEVWESLIPPHEWARAEAELASLSLPGGPASVNFEHRLVSCDGIEKWVESRAEIERDASGSPVRLVGTVLDISERVQDAERIRESERRTRAVVQNAPLALWELDEHGIITSAQGKALGFIGRTALDFEGKSIFGILSDIEPLQNLARRALAGEACEGAAWFGDRFFEIGRAHV